MNATSKPTSAHQAALARTSILSTVKSSDGKKISFQELPPSPKRLLSSSKKRESFSLTAQPTLTTMVSTVIRQRLNLSRLVRITTRPSLLTTLPQLRQRRPLRRHQLQTVVLSWVVVPHLTQLV